jgi:hypothetical protein
MCAAMGLATAAAAQSTPGVVPTPLPVIYEMETLRTGPLPQEFLKQIEPLHSLAAVEDLLKANRIAFAWGHGDVSSGTMPAAFAKQIAALPPHEVFIVPQSKGLVINIILTKH